MDEEKYVIFNQNGEPINLIIWNGDHNTWQPPEGTTTKLLSEVDPALLAPKQ